MAFRNVKFSSTSFSFSAASSVHYTTSCNTQSSAPGDGRNYRPKHVELFGIINKPLLLHLVGCLYYCKIFMVFDVWIFFFLPDSNNRYLA